VIFVYSKFKSRDFVSAIGLAFIRRIWKIIFEINLCTCTSAILITAGTFVVRILKQKITVSSNSLQYVMDYWRRRVFEVRPRDDLFTHNFLVPPHGFGIKVRYPLQCPPETVNSIETSSSLFWAWPKLLLWLFDYFICVQLPFLLSIRTF
jgi:hypothetical protein